MNIKIFQHFHINNNQEKLTFNKNPLDTNIETDDTTLKTTSDAISAIGRASVSFQAKKISPEIAKTIIQKSKEGISIEDIVLLLGGIVSASAITTLLDKHAKTEQIIELYKNGESFAEIGKKVDCSSPTVRHYLEELDNWEELRAEHNARLNKQTFSPDLISR